MGLAVSCGVTNNGSDSPLHAPSVRTSRTAILNPASTCLEFFMDLLLAWMFIRVLTVGTVGLVVYLLAAFFIPLEPLRAE